jgi:hypothetical protein
MVGENDVQPDLADRLKKSLKLAGVSVQGMADFLECNRNTPGNWLNRRIKPHPSSLKLWAQKTSVPYEWLRDGNWPDDNQSVTNDDDQAELAAPEWLREISAAHQQISAALQQIADRLE